MVAVVVVPSGWLDGGLVCVTSEDAGEFHLRIVVFAYGSADLHCSPGEDLDFGGEAFFVAEEGREEPVRVVHVIS